MKLAIREHEICAGHRVVGHESKCAHLHGHGYVITFHCAGPLDTVGRVLDFGNIKQRLCFWLEDNWDHKFLYWDADPVLVPLIKHFPEPFAGKDPNQEFSKAKASFVAVPFNPTAENMADYLLNVIGPIQLQDTSSVLIRVDVQETRKCSATVSLPELLLY